MKRIILFLLLIMLALTFISCDSHADITIDGKDEANKIEDIDKNGQKYIISIKSKTFHLEDCYIVKNIDEENIREIYDRDFLIEREFVPCKKCTP